MAQGPLERVGMRAHCARLPASEQSRCTPQGQLCHCTSLRANTMMSSKGKGANVPCEACARGVLCNGMMAKTQTGGL